MRNSEPPPIRRDSDPFRPIEEDEDFELSLEDYERDRGLLRVVGVVVALGVLIAVLILPPISLLDRGSDPSGGGISTRARDDLPALPDGLAARSELYDIQVDDSLAGPATLTVRLNGDVEEGEHLGFYTNEGGEWRRLGAVSVIDDGGAVQGQVEAVPANIAVLARTAFARQFGLIVEAGEAPDPAAASAASVVAVLAGHPGENEAGEPVISVESGGLDAALATAGDAHVYLAVSADSVLAEEAIDRILATPSLVDGHVDVLLTAAEGAGAEGLLIDYGLLDPPRRGPFGRFVARLNAAAQAQGLGLIIAVPTPVGADFGAYDWPALAETSDGLWVRAPRNAAAYYDQLETALAAQQDAELDFSRVSLVLDRRSWERSADGLRPLTLQQSLALAGALRGRADGAIEPGKAISVTGVNIDRDAGNTGLHWDDRARAVSFAYAGRGGPRTVWVENRFSMAFRLDLSRRFNLGGIAVAGAAPEAGLPDLWETIVGYVEDGALTLELPYGPYLEPQWTVSDGLVEGSGDRGVIVWRAPEREGAYDITLVVSDGTIFVGQQLVMRVSVEPPEAPPTAGSDEGATDDGGDAADDAATDDAATDDAATDDANSDAAGGDSAGAAAEEDSEATPEPTSEPTPEPTPEPTATPSSPPGPAGN